MSLRNRLICLTPPSDVADTDLSQCGEHADPSEPKQFVPLNLSDRTCKEIGEAVFVYYSQRGVKSITLPRKSVFVAFVHTGAIDIDEDRRSH